MRRVEEDVAAGRLSMARQRLRGLVGSYPQRLDLREQLADLYRREGILSQAGRWSFLSESRDYEELRAFEREYADPVDRMRAVGWRGPEDAAGELARERLAALRAEAERKVGRPVPWERAAQLQTDTTWGDRVFAVVAILVLGLVVLGGISFLIEGIRTVVHWLSG
jgi:hypothetical protein